MGLTRIQKAKRAQLALARAARHKHSKETVDDSDDDAEFCSWDGTINHYLSDNSDSEWTDSDVGHLACHML